MTLTLNNLYYRNNVHNPTFKACLKPSSFLLKDTVQLKANNNLIPFGSDFTNTKVTDKSGNVIAKYNHESYFFRDHNTLEFVKSYISEHFPTAHIADFGSSDGSETYTIAMILDDINQDGRYTITGYDTIPEKVKNAKEGYYKIHKINHWNNNNKTEDYFLVENYLSIKSFLERYLSNDCYKNRPEEPFLTKYKKLFKKHFLIIKNHKITKNKEIHLPFKIRPDAFKNTVHFEVGDIRNLGTKELQLPENTKVIIFKNAWYHLLGNNNTIQCIEDENNYKAVDEVVKQIYQSLPENGLLVTGSLDRDHKINRDSKWRFIEYQGKKIMVVDDSDFHQILLTNNFKPLHYAKTDKQIYDGSTLAWHFVYVPSVWKKTIPPEKTNKS